MLISRKIRFFIHISEDNGVRILIVFNLINLYFLSNLNHCMLFNEFGFSTKLCFVDRLKAV